MNELRDHSARRRFAGELDRNFSVVASAGSGKTHAITERIVQLARTANAIASRWSDAVSTRPLGGASLPSM